MAAAQPQVYIHLRALGRELAGVPQKFRADPHVDALAQRLGHVHAHPVDAQADTHTGVTPPVVQGQLRHLAAKLAVIL